MPTQRLSTKLVETIKPPGSGRADYWDSVISDDENMPGSFGLRVFSSGVKSWQVMYRVRRRDGTLQQKRMTLGGYPGFGLSEAREKAREALKLVDRGEDPAEHRKKSTAKLAATPTLVEAAHEFIESYAKPRNRSWKETERIFNRYVLPSLGERLLPTITRSDLAGVINQIASGGAPYMANRVLATVRRFFQWCLEQGKVEVSPAASIKAPARESSRDRILSDDEIRAVWSAGDAMGWRFGPLFQLLLIAGQREDEVAGMRWSDLDVQGALWTLPRQMSKSDRLNQVPLPSLALAILETLPRTGELIFSTTGSTPSAAFPRRRSVVTA